MKQLRTQLLTLMVCLTGGWLHAQSFQPFWTEDFTNNIPAQWTSVDASGQGVVWEWCKDNASGCSPVFDGEDPFNSSSAVSGFVVVNSDAAQQLPQNHVSRLTTAAINCSGKNTVFAQFESHIGTFLATPAASAILRVSTDLTNWQNFTIFPGLTAQNKFSPNPTVSIVDISSKAANQSTVYLQWQWTGNYEYMWNLDDIALYDQNPTARFDLEIAGFFYPVSSYATPASQIGTDTFGFFLFLSNKGLEPMTNVKSKVTVEKSTGEILFADSVLTASIEPGVIDSLIEMPNIYPPQLPEGEYFIRYSVSADSFDLRPENNMKGSPFLVTDFVFSKESHPQTATRSDKDVPWYAGNYYTMSAGALDQYKAMTAEFAFATDSTELDNADVVATIYLLRVNDDVPSNFAGFDASEFPGTSLEWIGYADYEAPDDIINGQLQQAELTDLNTLEDGVLLEPGGRYFLMAGYPESVKQTNHAFNTEITYLNALSTAVFSDMWYLGGFGDELSAVMRMYISLLSTTDERPLADSAFRLFPNPANDQINFALRFDRPTDVTLTLADITGRVIKIEDKKAVTQEIINRQISQLSPGTYIARLATAEGTKTLRFVKQ
ncbi:MAG: T9SS type A sorting domain-containing protein [Lewinellaceae bacterium]|nr:T9SS type A sorting domain-containing protein [Lewinellaceae bacterium]